MEYHNLTKIISLQKYNMPTMKKPIPVTITTVTNVSIPTVDSWYAWSGQRANLQI